MEVNTEPADFFAAHLVIGIDEAKKILSLGSRKKWGIKEFGDPIHLVRIGQVKCYLDIFVGVFNHDDAIVVDISILPFPLEEDHAAFLYFGWSEVRLLEKGNDIFKRQRLGQLLLIGRTGSKRATGPEHANQR